MTSQSDYNYCNFTLLSCLSQETSKRPFDLRVKQTHTVKASHCFFLLLSVKPEIAIFMVFDLILPGIEPESTACSSQVDRASATASEGFIYYKPQYVISTIAIPENVETLA